MHGELPTQATVTYRNTHTNMDLHAHTHTHTRTHFRVQCFTARVQWGQIRLQTMKRHVLSSSHKLQNNHLKSK